MQQYVTNTWLKSISHWAQCILKPTLWLFSQFQNRQTQQLAESLQYSGFLTHGMQTVMEGKTKWKPIST